ncbi:MAG: hypothetical protein RQ732_10895 [Methylophaga sp.]|nr:hypothetical protein [Methylophaga sp.]
MREHNNLNSGSSLKEKIDTVLAASNEDAPKMIDDVTRFDKATSQGGSVITYHYSFPDYASTDLDSDILINNMRLTIPQKICNDKYLLNILKDDGKIQYTFTGNNKIEIGQLEVSKSDCGLS